MINLLKETEIEYIRCFSKEDKTKSVIRFWDENFEDSYASNLTILNKKINEEEIIKTINNEINEKRKAYKDFLLFELDGDVKDDTIKNLNLWPSRIDKLDYMIIKTKKYMNMEYREDCLVTQVSTIEEFNDLIRINVLDYAPLVGRGYAKRRINRKTNVYKDSSNKLTSYISYLNKESVGSCELLINRNIAKIEDFGVLLPYQKKGVGKSMLYKILQNLYNSNVETAYVITESNGTAKDIYTHYGFEKIGEKTQLIFSF